MGGFGLALALPFALFALFPNWLNSLPKSGGWLNSVKVVLGFIEVGAGNKIFIQCRPGNALGYFKKGSIYWYMDTGRRRNYTLPAWV